MDVQYEISGAEHAAVVTYYRGVMPRLVRHFGETPVVWVTYPKELGIDPAYHKDVRDVPGTISTVRVSTSTGQHRYVALNEHNLMWLVAGRFAVEIHGWSPVRDDPDRAAYARIVLSPHGAADDASVVRAARLLRAILAREHLQAIPILDGFRGITLWIPFDDAPPYERLGPWAHDFAARCAAEHEELLTVENVLAERGDRVYLGTKSNHPGMGSLLPYALRGTPSLEVSLPVHWDELDRVRNGDVTAANYAEHEAANVDRLLAMRDAIAAQHFGDREPRARAERLIYLVERPEPAPHGYIIAAALQVLADGKPHSADDILEQALKRHLLPRSTTRKYVSTALREYVVRTLGAGRKPEFVQLEGGSVFRLNREPDTWPDVALPPRPAWLTAEQIDHAITELEATSVGGDPSAFEVAVTEAFSLLGFVARHVGGNAAPDVVIDAPLGTRGYRTIVECKTASEGGIVANPRADEPARFRDAGQARYALLIGPSFGNLTALDDELRQHGVALWTVQDLATCLRRQFGPAELESLMAAGRIADRLHDAEWNDEHGERKRIAVVADLIHRELWAAQRTIAAGVPVSEAPSFTEDGVLLMVDEALGTAGVADGTSRAILRRAIAALEARDVLRNVDGGMIAVVPYAGSLR